MPLVSIVTPTYNQADFLAETIDSVLSQDYPNIQYIVINDGSTDSTEDVLKRYGDRLLWLTQNNTGQAETLNKGWALATGKYIGYLSSDDLLHSSAISELVDILEQNDDVVCAYPNCNLIDERSVVIKGRVCKGFNLEELVVCQECYIGPGAIFRSDAFRKVGGWKKSLKLAPDREFWMRLAGCGEFYFLNADLASYRLHRGSISYRYISEEVSREYIKVLDDYYSGDQVPFKISERRLEAYGRAKYIVARNLFRSWNVKRGIEVYREACNDYPQLKNMKYIYQLARNALGKPVRIALGRIKRLL